MVVSKSVHKRGQNIRKLASKLTIWSPQHSKDTVHRYLRCNLEAYLCKRPVLPKISKNQTANYFSFPRRDRSGQVNRLEKDYIYRWMFSVPASAWKLELDSVRAQNRSTLEKTQKSKFSPKIMVWGAMTASGASNLHVLPPNQTVRAKQVNTGKNSDVQVFSKNHGLGRNDSFRCVQPTCVASKPNCES